MQVGAEKRLLCHVVVLQPYLPAAQEGVVAPHPLHLRNLAAVVAEEALHPLLPRSPVVVVAVGVVLQTVLPRSPVVVAEEAVVQRYFPLNRLR